MKDTFVWWLLIESFVLLLDKILRNGIARSTLCFFFSMVVILFKLRLLHFFFPVFVLFVLKLGIMGLVLNGCSMRFMSYCLIFMAI